MNKNSIRIIGGKHRGRKIPILPNSPIRPTSDRVRETLFNWLMHDIANARVLDLFTGSGAISIEALSRGASFVLFNDSNKKNIDHINGVFQTLNIQPVNFKSSCSDTLKLLQQKPSDLKLEPFDIIILDPPFNKDFINTSLDLIIQNNWLNTNAHKQSLIYLEAEKEFDTNTINSINMGHFSVLKQKSTGNVFYGLLKLNKSKSDI